MSPLPGGLSGEKIKELKSFKDLGERGVDFLKYTESSIFPPKSAHNVIAIIASSGLYL